MSNMFIGIYSGGGGMMSIKHLKGSASYKSFGTSVLAACTTVDGPKHIWLIKFIDV
jgi:hypothetical protein